MKKLTGKARVADVAGLARVLAEAFAKSEEVGKDEFLAAKFESLSAIAEKMTEAVNRGKTESRLVELDCARDEKFRAFSSVLSGYADFPDEKVRENGAALKALFDRYGAKILRETYASETTLIESLLKDFDSDEAKARISALAGVGDALFALKEAQLRFVEGQIEFGKARAKEKSEPSASELKKPAVSLINDSISPYLRLMSQSDEGRFGEFAKFFEGQVENVNRSRAARKEAEKKKEA